MEDLPGPHSEAPDGDAAEPERGRGRHGRPGPSARPCTAAGPTPRTVTVCDRAGGIRARFGTVRTDSARLLVRPGRGRAIRSDGATENPWDAGAGPPVPGTKTTPSAPGGDPREHP